MSAILKYFIHKKKKKVLIEEKKVAVSNVTANFVCSSVDSVVLLVITYYIFNFENIDKSFIHCI